MSRELIAHELGLSDALSANERVSKLPLLAHMTGFLRAQQEHRFSTRRSGEQAERPSLAHRRSPGRGDRSAESYGSASFLSEGDRDLGANTNPVHPLGPSAPSSPAADVDGVGYAEEVPGWHR